MNHLYRSTLKIKILFATFTALLLNQLCTANANADLGMWEFHLDPVPMLVMTGDRKKASTLVIKVSEECKGLMVAFLPSVNEKNLVELKGEVIPVSFGINIDSERVEVLEELKLHSVISSEETKKEASAVFRVFEFDNINELKGTIEPGNSISFYIKAKNTELFNMSYESWSFEGLEAGLEEANDWCTKGVSNMVSFKHPQLLFI